MVGWRTPTDHNHGYVLPKDVNTEDIICHKGATPADLSVIVKAGDTITCGWTRWPDGHHGPIMNYFGNCNGPCAKADKTKVKFNKMSELGLIHPIKGVKIGDVVNYQTAGYWGTDKFSFEDHYKVSFTVPEDAATGEYIYRNELIALHSAMATAEGAQLYPQCISLKVTAKEGATNTDDYTDGTLGMELYSPEDPGFHIDIYRNPGTYQIPGPKVRTGHGSSTDNKTPVSSAASEMATSSATYQVASSTMASQEASSTMASQEASSTVASQEASSTVASQEVSATVSRKSPLFSLDCRSVTAVSFSFRDLYNVRPSQS